MTFRRLRSLEKYFELLGCDKNYTQKHIPCEICDSYSFTTICRYTDTGNNILAPVPVKACNSCGFLMQNPRFDKEFYIRYYEEFYPYMRVRSASNTKNDPNKVAKKIVCDDGKPSEYGFTSTLERAKNLYNYIIKSNLKIPQKKMLDVGCGCGGFLKYFKDKGFEVFGNDPDNKATDFGIMKGLKIDKIPAEEMHYKEKFGLIIIIGSLEHCFDPNKVLSKCWEMLIEDGIIIIEGRYFPISESFRWLNSNHHRFFTNVSSQSILIKHGFEIIKSTTDPVCGEDTGRNGGGFAFARKKSSNIRFLNLDIKEKKQKFLKLLKDKRLIKKPEEILEETKKHDEAFHIKYIDD